MHPAKRIDRAPAAWIRIALAVVSVTLLIGPVESQQTRNDQRKPPARKCTLAIDELDAIFDLLDEIEQPPIAEEFDETEDNAESTNPPTTDDGCRHEINRLRLSVSRLQNSYHNMKQNLVGIDAREYELMQNRYVLGKRDLALRLEQLTKQSNSQHRFRLNELQRKIKEIEKKLNESVNTLAQQRQQNVNSLIQLVANNIVAGQVTKASANFGRLMTYSADPYRAIVDKVQLPGHYYDAGFTIRFLGAVHFKHEPVAGYEALVDELIKRDELRGSNAVELLKHLQALVLAQDGKQQERAVALLKKFKTHAF